MTRRRRNEKKGAKSTMMHLSVNIAAKNTQPKRRMSVGSWRKIKTHARLIGRQPRAVDGVRSQQKLRCGNQKK
jgi:hypothetical protein